MSGTQNFRYIFKTYKTKTTLDPVWNRFWILEFWILNGFPEVGFLLKSM
jgi:hypothetical protein